MIIDVKNYSNEELSQLEKVIQEEKNKRREKYIEEYNDKLSALFTEIREAGLIVVSSDEDGYSYDSVGLYVRGE